jgi:hypothetical protein
VYTLAALHGLVDREPAHWLGRTLLVQGEAIATSCVERAGTLVLCAPPRMFLTEPDSKAGVALLPLDWAGIDPLLAGLRRLPLVGGFAPPPQVVHWEQVAVYRVQLRTPADTSGGSDSYEALLLDAAP